MWAFGRVVGSDAGDPTANNSSIGDCVMGLSEGTFKIQLTRCRARGETCKVVDAEDGIDRSAFKRRS